MTAKLTDPVGAARLAAIIAPAIRRTKKAPAPLKADAPEVDRDFTTTPHRTAA